MTTDSDTSPDLTERQHCALLELREKKRIWWTNTTHVQTRTLNQLVKKGLATFPMETFWEPVDGAREVSDES